MNRFSTLTILLAATLGPRCATADVRAPSPAVTPETGVQSQQRKPGTLFKGEVDGLIRALRGGARANGALGDGTVLDTARVITAMGYCHRLYTLADGPVVRGSVNFLFSGRRSDGSFGDPVTTGWVLAALRVMDAEEHAQELASWRQSSGTAGADPWQEMVNEVLAASADGVYPEKIAAPVAARVAASETGESAVEDLVRLVACQYANRLLDQGRDPTGGFSPAQQKAIDFLLGQQEDGVFFIRTPGGNFPDAGLTGMALAALQTKPAAYRTERERQVVSAGLEWLLGIQNEDGSFSEENINYTTCAAINALSMSTHPRAKEAMEKAQRFVLAIQNTEDRGYSSEDRDYGSIGYGGDERGDLSNLQFALESLRNSGLESDHEAFAKAIVFLQRTQNLRSVNDFKGKVVSEAGESQDVVAGNDGGAAYYPGNSPAGYIQLPDGTAVPRSYGSMTYALLKAYTLAGVDGDDPRVQAAVNWISGHWTVEVNPGADPALGEDAPYQGLFYYYTVMAQALAAAGVDEIETANGGQVDWRQALKAHLEQLQSPDGSWRNERNSRWWEDQSLVCTFYALLALHHCR